LKLGVLGLNNVWPRPLGVLGGDFGLLGDVTDDVAVADGDRVVLGRS
jgi:hypothetical protein